MASTKRSSEVVTVASEEPPPKKHHHPRPTFKCPICYETFNDREHFPLIQACQQHTVCLRCIHEQIRIVQPKYNMMISDTLPTDFEIPPGHEVWRYTAFDLGVEFKIVLQCPICKSDMANEACVYVQWNGTATVVVDTVEPTAPAIANHFYSPEFEIDVNPPLKLPLELLERLQLKTSELLPSCPFCEKPFETMKSTNAV